MKEALGFLRDARTDEVAQRELRALGDDVTWGDLAALAVRRGYDVTAAELERGHALDWGMRWARYRDAGQP